MNRGEFMDYVRENFNVDGAAMRLIANILRRAEGIPDENEQYLFLCDMLDGTIGFTDQEIKMILPVKEANT